MKLSTTGFSATADRPGRPVSHSVQASPTAGPSNELHTFRPNCNITTYAIAWGGSMNFTSTPGWRPLIHPASRLEVSVFVYQDCHRIDAVVTYVARMAVLSGSLSPRHGATSRCGWRNGLQLWRVAANTLNKQSRTADKGWSSSCGGGGLGEVLTTPHRKKIMMLRSKKSLGPGQILWYDWAGLG
jgi:hypothetical protein